MKDKEILMMHHDFHNCFLLHPYSTEEGFSAHSCLHVLVPLHLGYMAKHVGNSAILLSH